MRDNRIIWSADVPDTPTLLAHLRSMPNLGWIKIDRLFATLHGLSVIDQLKEYGILVFDDAKIIEIPSKLVAVAKAHLVHRPDMLNCIAGGLSNGVFNHLDSDQQDGLKRFADACHQVGTKPCGVTILTSKTPAVVTEEFNGRSHIEQVLYYVDILRVCGFTNIVCSPAELQAIRSESQFDHLELNVPGIRPVSSVHDDQARVNTPRNALNAGATRLVIGRPITEGDPAKNLSIILKSIS